MSLHELYVIENLLEANSNSVVYCDPLMAFKTLGLSAEPTLVRSNIRISNQIQFSVGFQLSRVRIQIQCL